MMVEEETGSAEEVEVLRLGLAEKVEEKVEWILRMKRRYL